MESFTKFRNCGEKNSFRARSRGCGFGVWEKGEGGCREFRVPGLGFRVSGVGVSGLGIKVQSLGFREFGRRW